MAIYLRQSKLSPLLLLVDIEILSIFIPSLYHALSFFIGGYSFNLLSKDDKLIPINKFQTQYYFL